MIDDNLLRSIKAVSLPNLLNEFGIRPAQRKELTSLKIVYKATYRGDQNPSLSVFMNRDGQWCFKDHATGEYGTNLDLLVRFGIFDDWRAAAAYVAERHLGVQIDGRQHAGPFAPRLIEKESSSKYDKGASGIIHGIRPIIGSPAASYIINIRKIPIEIASQYVSFVRYSHFPGGRIFSGIGWPTRRGGWSIRWAIDLGPGKGKAFVGPGGMSFFPTANGVQSQNGIVFEGLFDFLTYVTLHGMDCDAVVLNSVDNYNNSLDLLNSYRCVYGYLDRDEHGRECWSKISAHCGDKAIDASDEFAGYKDYNDFLKTY